MDQAIATAARGASKNPSLCARAGARTLPRPQRRLPGMVAEAFGIGPDDLAGASRGCAKVALARQAAMYLARVAIGLTLAEAAHLFGRDRTTAAHACRVIEDKRDDAAFDAKLSAIEEALR
jgi:chromosomal replication initiation ATPase DnaA